MRGQLLMMSPMPKLAQVLALLQQDERQRGYFHIASHAPESDVLLSKQISRNRFQKIGFKKNDLRFQKKGNMECTYCPGTNHTRDRCYHLIGFPPRNMTGINNASRFSTNTDNKIVAQVQSGNAESTCSRTITHDDKGANLSNNLSAAQYQQLLALLSQSQISQTTMEPHQSGIMYHTCSYFTSVCLINCHTSSDWILDSGATDHITCNPSFLSNITFSGRNGKAYKPKHEGVNRNIPDEI